MLGGAVCVSSDAFLQKQGLSLIGRGNPQLASKDLLLVACLLEIHTCSIKTLAAKPWNPIPFCRADHCRKKGRDGKRRTDCFLFRPTEFYSQPAAVNPPGPVQTCSWVCVFKMYLHGVSHALCCV